MAIFFSNINITFSISSGVKEVSPVTAFSEASLRPGGGVGAGAGAPDPALEVDPDGSARFAKLWIKNIHSLNPVEN